jgi:hypothetical protein
MQKTLAYLSVQLFLFFAVLSAESSAQKILENVLNTRVQQGVITEGQKIAIELWAIKSPEKVPAEYASFPLAGRCGTFYVNHARQRLPFLTQEDQELVMPLINRPSKDELPEEKISASGLFKIHYTSERQDAATTEFVDETARTFDFVYDVEVRSMGYRPPPQDFDVDGPEYDIYVHNLGTMYYGVTTGESSVPDTPQDDATSFIEIDNDFSDTPTKSLDGMRVTAAHEFFHAVQLGYRDYAQLQWVDPLFLYEASSSWMEDVVFDDINDYYYYLPSFFKVPDQQFHCNFGTHPNALCLFNHMIIKKYGENILRKIWENYQFDEVFDALDLAFVEKGSSFQNELAQFSVWNIFTGSRADTVRFYPEGTHYPEISPEKVFEFDEKTSFDGSLASLASQPYLLIPQLTCDLSVQPQFEDSFHWLYAIVYFPFQGEPQYFITGGDKNKSIEQVRAFSEIWIIPTNVEVPEINHSTSSKEYSFNVEKGSIFESAEGVVAISPNPFKPRDHTKAGIQFSLSAPSSDVHLLVFSENGIPIKDISRGQLPDGYNEASWDGRNEHGDMVPSGIYLVYIKADKLIGPGKIAVIR